MKELILIEFDGIRYGVWKDELKLDGFDVPHVHGLPSGRSLLSGVAEHDGKMCMFYDLSASLGHGMYERKRPGRGALLTGGDRPVGFVFRREAGRVMVNPADVLTLPGFISTSEISACIRVNEHPVLIVNIPEVLDRALDGLFTPRREMLRGGSSEVIAPASGSARIVSIGGEKYALPSDIVTDTFNVSDADVHMVPFSPERVIGLVVRDGRTFGVIDPSALLGCEGNRGSGLVVAGREAGWAFGVEEIIGNVDAPAEAIQELPALAAGALRHALVADEIIPYLDPVQFIVRDPFSLTASPDFEPDDLMLTSFGTRDLGVQEFAVGDTRHAIPGSEIKKTIPSVPFRRLLPQRIAVGVALFDGVLLPVIDIAMCFGMQSPLSSNTRMAIYENGGLRALMLAGQWGKKVVVPKDELAPLPVTLPRPYVYGCSTSEGMVRLIMNTAELVLHFVPGDTVLQEDEAESSHAYRDVQHMGGDHIHENVQEIPTVQDAKSAPTEGEKQEDLPMGTVSDKDEIKIVEEPVTVVLLSEVKDELTADETLSTPEKTIEEVVPARMLEESFQAELITEDGLSDKGSTTDEVAVKDEEQVLPVPPPERPILETVRKGRSPWTYAVTGLLVVLALVYIMAQAASHRSAPADVQVKRHETVTQDAVALPADESRVTPAVKEQEAPKPEPVKRHLVIEVGTGDERTVVESKKPLEVPKVLQGTEEAIHYVVREGDTLWDISKRLTGDPFLFSTIAGDNDIENPDLIFPGQGITLRLSREK